MNSEKYYDTNNHSSNNTSLNHTIEMIRAASPHLSSDNKSSIDLFIKVSDLIDTLNTMKRGSQTVSAQSMNPSSIDMEGLLTSIRNVCYEKERQMVDMILNFFKAKRMYETFSTLSQLITPDQDMSNFAAFSNFDMFQSNASGSNSSETNPPTRDTIPNDTTYTQTETYFDGSIEPNTYQQEQPELHAASGESYQSPTLPTDNNLTASSSSNSGNNMETMLLLLQGMQKNNASESGSSTNRTEMLNSILTPEQKTTFETLSLLMNTV